jgi:hypothetical protein
VFARHCVASGLASSLARRLTRLHADKEIVDRHTGIGNELGQTGARRLGATRATLSRSTRSGRAPPLALLLALLLLLRGQLRGGGGVDLADGRDATEPLAIARHRRGHLVYQRAFHIVVEPEQSSI